MLLLLMMLMMLLMIITSRVLFFFFYTATQNVTTQQRGANRSPHERQDHTPPKTANGEQQKTQTNERKQIRQPTLRRVAKEPQARGRLFFRDLRNYASKFWGREGADEDIDLSRRPRPPAR